ncbi:hypothetical protein niasHT_009012 [Heterodera trifolii]|uniref:Uncharacterized protein n=1 Tax=Heterodera trifolii TaxID=157864 RepID=A0ABD2LW71_9BILA
MIAFGNPNGQWPLSGGTELTAEEQMPISDAKIALDKALIDPYQKMADQMHKMQIVGAESVTIGNQLNTLPTKPVPNNAPKLGSINATINKAASGTKATEA